MAGIITFQSMRALLISIPLGIYLGKPIKTTSTLGYRLLKIDSRLSLNDGNQIPALGLGSGVRLAEANGEAEQACLWALKHGYRHIDTGEIYR